MKKVIVTVECSDQNYWGYIEDFPGCTTAAKTFDELKNNMIEALALYIEESEEIPEYIKTGKYELEYKFDTQSLLAHYEGILTKSALERLTGINQKQLGHYASGISHPRPKQAKKIEEALHQLGKELLSVSL